MGRFAWCCLLMGLLLNVGAAEELPSTMPDFQVLQLVDRMQSGELANRLAAARELNALSQRSDEALPYLLALLESDDPEARRLVLYVLGKWDIARAPVLEAVFDRLEDEHPDVRAMAVLSISRLGPDAAAAAEKLVELLADDQEQPRIRAGAAMALSELGKAGRQGVPEMIQALSSPHLQLRQMAETSLRDVEGFVVPGLALAVKEREDPLSRSYACLQLNKLGLKAAGACEALAYAVRNDDNPEVRADALKALNKITSEVRKAQAELRQEVGFADNLSREAQQEKLQRFEQQIRHAVLAFGFALQRKDEKVPNRMEAAVALADCKAAALPAREAIDSAIKDPNPLVSLSAQEAKKRIIASLPGNQ